MAISVQPPHFEPIHRVTAAIWHAFVVSSRAVGHVAVRIYRHFHPDLSTLSRSERKRLRKERIQQLKRHKR